MLGSALLWLTVLAGSGSLGWSLFGMPLVGDVGLAALVVCAAIVGELLKVTIYEARRQTLSFSLSVVVIMAAITIDPVLGPMAALVSSAAHVLVARQRAPIKIAFNLSNPVMSAGVAAWVYASTKPLNRKNAGTAISPACIRGHPILVEGQRRATSNRK